MFARALRPIFKFHLGVWIYGDFILFRRREGGTQLSLDGARSFCGKNVQRFVKDRRDARVQIRDQFNRIPWPRSEEPLRNKRVLLPLVARRKERQLHARIWIIVIQVSSVEVDVEIASKFGHRDSGPEHPRGTGLCIADVFRC